MFEQGRLNGINAKGCVDASASPGLFRFIALEDYADRGKLFYGKCVWIWKKIKVNGRQPYKVEWAVLLRWKGLSIKRGFMYVRSESLPMDDGGGDR